MASSNVDLMSDFMVVADLCMIKSYVISNAIIYAIIYATFFMMRGYVNSSKPRLQELKKDASLFLCLNSVLM